MNAEIITIGDEILIGQITDTNSQWIATELNKIGVAVYQITSIQDKKPNILTALADAETRANIIILTGGLGPTKDDITKYTIAEYFKSELQLYPEIEEHIRYLFDKYGLEFSELNRQQAILPVKAEILKNRIGTASGMWFAKNGKIFVSLPGVPNEMKGLMQSEVLPKIKESFSLPHIIHRTIRTYGMGESKLALKIEKWQDALPEFIKLAYLPNYGQVRLRLSAIGQDRTLLENSLDEQIKKLTVLIEDIIIGFDEEDAIEAVIGKLLVENKQTLAVAESCTGGNVSKMITAIAGASRYFIGAITSYNVITKTNFLNVSKETIDKHSVVSEAVAVEMAKGIQKQFKADYAIGVTGNAGPSKDDTDEEVGKVFIAVASPTTVFVEECYFSPPRAKVIQRASVKALQMLRIAILKNNKNSL